MDIINPILSIVLGILLLTTGKKLYWLFVAVVGFVIGLALAIQLNLSPLWLNYVVAFGAGVIGAILGTFLQKLAIALVGFVVGGYGAFYLTSTLLGLNAEPTNWMAFIIGGIVGLLLVASVFNWALYILSSWAGATLVTRTVTEGVKMNPTIGLVIFFVLFVLGMVIQAGLFREQPKKQPAEVKPEVEPAKKEE
jgi:MFS family permease